MGSSQASRRVWGGLASRTRAQGFEWSKGGWCDDLDSSWALNSASLRGLF